MIGLFGQIPPIPCQWCGKPADTRPDSHDAVAINTALHGNSEWERAA